MATAHYCNLIIVGFTFEGLVFKSLCRLAAKLWKLVLATSKHNL